jgi:hypothetical protein
MQRADPVKQFSAMIGTGHLCCEKPPCYEGWVTTEHIRAGTLVPEDEAAATEDAYGLKDDAPAPAAVEDEALPTSAPTED